MKFSDLGNAVAKAFQKMVSTGLYRVEIDGESLWKTYLESFPEGSNPVYRTRTEHDCSCCRGFVKKIGGVVSIVDGKLATVWDIKIDGPYQAVADAMAKMVRLAVEVGGIDNIFLHTEATVGVGKNRELLADKSVKEWEHFFVNLPREVVARGVDIGPKLSDSRSSKDVMLRSLKEITPEAIDTVLDLIAQNSLYRGQEHEHAVRGFEKVKKAFDKLSSDEAKELFCWERLQATQQPIARIRNTVIGTLLVDLSEGKDMEESVKSFESKVAPTNYKRPTALITKAMIQKAKDKIEELGFTSALERRFATIEDITVNNIIFADREAKKAMNVFDELSEKVADKTPNLDRVEEVSIEDFISKILPKAESVEVMVENRLVGNLVSLIAPVDPTAKNMFKWPHNNFSWSYAGELADSIKERVKAAGGKIDADFRASLSWFNNDDLDLWLLQPGGFDIGYYTARAPSKDTYSLGQLDLDMNGSSGMAKDRRPVENIIFPDRAKMREGEYVLRVNQYSKRESIDVGFAAEIEFDGQVYSFAYEKAIPTGKNVIVARFTYTKKEGLKIIESLPSTQTSKTVWSIPTQTFRKVSVVMLSPNHWDGAGVGNRHYFFMLEGCLNEGKARGFFNEFLTSELDAHRKVFEAVGSKMKTEESDRQLSGLGFSSTKRDKLLCRVKGSFSRVVQITF